MIGSFIAFEGGEGCGKSTQARILANGLDAVLTREPGGTDIGARLRAILLNPLTKDLCVQAEALLMAADRAQHVHEVIRPNLHAGRHVVSDRYLYSSVAYQGGGRGLPGDDVRELSLWATERLEADLVILLDLAPEVAQLRLDRELDRFELSTHQFHEAVRTSFLEQAAADPTRWVVLDASCSVEDLENQVAAVVFERLGLESLPSDD